MINVVSGVSVEGRAEWGAYSVSKFGIEGLTDTGRRARGARDPRERRRPGRDAHGDACRRLPRRGPHNPHYP